MVMRQTKRKATTKASAKEDSTETAATSIPAKDQADKNKKVSNVTKSRKRNSSSFEDNEVAKRPRLDVHNVANKVNGTIMTLGQGDMGQLGLGEDILSRKKPAIVKDLANDLISKVATGAMHTVCLTTDNKLYSFGCNDEYALGRETDEDTDPEYFPRPIAGPLLTHQVVRLTAGDSHTMALTNDGKVFLWGCFRDSHGQLGMFSEGEVCKCPTHIDTLNEAIVSIASGNDHIALVSISGKVYTMGCSEQGQLGRIARYFADRSGRRKTTNVLLTPRLVKLPKIRGSFGKPVSISQVFCGAYSTYVRSTEGQVFTWGLNNYGQLGFPDKENRFLPCLSNVLSALDIKQIKGGQHHTIVLDSIGRVYAIGRGDYGRLGLGEDVTQADEPTQIKTLPTISSIAACACVSFAVGLNGVGYGWGIGTNLQLSTGQEEDEWEPVKITGKNLEGRKVLYVDAGGQHTVLLASGNEEDPET